MESKIHKMVIIGSGPAGHTAAIYAARANLEPVMYEGWMAGGVASGGQLTTTTEVENYPGFHEGVQGMDLTDNFRKQSERFGTQIISKTISKVDLKSRPFKVWVEGEEGGEPAALAHSIVITTGATARRLTDVKGEDTFWQKGVSACAVCDGALPLFRNKPLAVVGGGDSACEEASWLSKFGSKVYIIHRREELRASKIMAQRVLQNPKIELVWNSAVDEVYGEKTVTGIKVKNVVTGEIKDLPVGGLFWAIGHVPNTQFVKGQIATDEDGYIKTTPGSTLTNVEGVFAAGDVQDKRYRQAITAAGSGCMAALDAEHYLSAHL